MAPLIGPPRLIGPNSFVYFEAELTGPTVLVKLWSVKCRRSNSWMCLEHLSGIWSGWSGSRVWSLSVPLYPPPPDQDRCSIALQVGGHVFLMHLVITIAHHLLVPDIYLEHKSFLLQDLPNMMPGYFGKGTWMTSCSGQHYFFWVFGTWSPGGYIELFDACLQSFVTLHDISVSYTNKQYFCGYCWRVVKPFIAVLVTTVVKVVVVAVVG